VAVNGDQENARRGDALLVQVGLGSRDHFAALYDMFAPTIYGMARRIVRSNQLAEEVVQEAFVNVWVQATRFDPDRGSAASWIMTIAHRRAVDRVRSEAASRRRDGLAYHDALLLEREAHAATCHDDGCGSGEMIEALSVLSGKQRQALWLAFYGGFTYREISSLLDIPLATTKTRIRDGLILLRKSDADLNSAIF
jgi:RNA polymerase sigma-70 factor, ECF subfamily